MPVYVPCVATQCCWVGQVRLWVAHSVPLLNGLDGGRRGADHAVAALPNEEVAGAAVSLEPTTLPPSGTRWPRPGLSASGGTSPELVAPAGGGRAVLFSSLGLLGLIPWTHVLVVYYHNARVLTLLQDQLVMGVFYLSAATVYATRVPERWFPGTFDIW
eukprot:scaffold2654_cov202-Prasinococcus_capsulatus_cf.AAC.1